MYYSVHILLNCVKLVISVKGHETLNIHIQSTKLGSLTDPGEARGCSTNTVVID